MRPRAYVFYDSKAQDLRRHRASGCHYRSDWTATANQFQAADYCGGVVFLDGLCGIVYAVARAAIAGPLTIVLLALRLSSSCLLVSIRSMSFLELAALVRV